MSPFSLSPILKLRAPVNTQRMVHIFVLVVMILMLSQEEEKEFGSPYLSRLPCILVQDQGLEHTGCPCLCTEETSPLEMFFCTLLS